MKKSRFTDSQIIEALKRAEAGLVVPELCRELDLDEVRLHATQWMWMYNHERPNMALGGITPKQRLAMAA